MLSINREIFKINPEFAGPSFEPAFPPGLIVLGGQSGGGSPISSVEVFGFEDDNCSLPDLPETRYGLAAFKTSSNQLAVCGGWWEGKPDSTDCLTLDNSLGQWVRGNFEGTLFGEGVRGVATFDNFGVYIIHSWSISHLSNGDLAWALGPHIPMEVECACRVSESSFIIVGQSSRNNILEYSIIKNRWEDADTWPSIITQRKGPGCAATSNILMVAGGVTEEGDVLASVEIFRLDTKSLGRAANMSSPRSFFSLIPVGLTHPRLFAIGGRNKSSQLGDTEFYEEEENHWDEGPRLGEERSSFGVILIKGKFVCAENVTLHTCPTSELEEVCEFPEDQGTHFSLEETCFFFVKSIIIYLMTVNFCYILHFHFSILRNALCRQYSHRLPESRE